jgi:hypothetical protein
LRIFIIDLIDYVLNSIYQNLSSSQIYLSFSTSIHSSISYNYHMIVYANLIYPLIYLSTHLSIIAPSILAGLLSITLSISIELPSLIDESHITYPTRVTYIMIESSMIVILLSIDYEFAHLIIISSIYAALINNDLSMLIFITSNLLAIMKNLEYLMIFIIMLV